MPGKILARQAYRMYAVAVAILGAWTYLWTTNAVSMSTTNLGYSWLGVAAIGAVLAGSLTVGRPDIFNKREKRIKEFERGSLTGTPLNLYIAALGVMAIVSAAALSGLVVVDATLLGGGWAATALYGGVITVGMASRHSEAIKAAVTPTAN